MREPPDRFFARYYFQVLSLVAVLLAVLLLLIALNRGFSIDEFEHIHTAWYIQQGAVPYSDFFQHHHPLFWLLILPLLAIFGHMVTIVIVLRVVMFLCALGIGFLVFRIARRLARSREASFLALIFLLSTVMFAVFSIQIRPDVPQVLLGLLSFYCLIRFLECNRDKYMAYAGFWAALSFLFLQKSLFLLIAYGLLFLYFLWKKRIAFKPVFIFAAAFFLPLALFVVCLLLAGAMDDYLLTNWLLNMQFARGDRFTLFRTLNYYILKDLLLWLCAFLCFWFVLGKRRKQFNEATSVTAFISLVLLAALFLIKRPWGHNFLFPLAMLAILAALFLYHLFVKYNVKQTTRFLLVLLVVLSSFHFLLIRALDSNRLELARADFVLKNTSPGDCVYDGKNQFNLFRPDLHYFWFSLKPAHGLDTYNRLTDNRYGDYDICRLVKEKRPKFISDFRLDLAACGLDKLYKKTKYDNLYIRIDRKQPGR